MPDLLPPAPPPPDPHPSFDRSTEPKPTSPSLWQQLALPLFLFALLLAVLLGLSWALLLPSMTRINVGGSLLDASQVLEQEREMRAQIETLQLKRDQLVLPLHDAAYAALKDEKRASPSLLTLREEVLDAAAKLVTDGKDVVILESLTWDATARTLTLAGDVRHVGPRSMTVLASFVDALHELPSLKSIVTSGFVREEDPTIGFHSPFSLILTL